MPTTDYHSELGLPRVVNAAGTLTSFGGCRLRPPAAEAMAAASSRFVDLELLLERSGERVARLLGVEAALITAGASPALMQATAACIAGRDPAQRARLPVDPPARSEVVIQRCHRNPYDRALPTAGATFVEIGDSIRTHPWELESAIGERSAAVYHVLQADMLRASLSLDETIRIAHAHGLPVIVDAAAELPPISNLWELCGRGADLVAFSGGKEIGGPQASGLLVGSKDLVDAARFNGAPNYGVARPAKAGKENILGLLAALESYLAEDETARMAWMASTCERWLVELGRIDGVEATRFVPTQPGMHPVCIPKVLVRKPGAMDAAGAEKLAARLRAGSPSVLVDLWLDGLVLNPQTLDEGELEELHAALRSALAG